MGVSVEWCQWHSAGRGQGGYPSSYNAQNSLNDKELSDPNVNSAEAEKLWPMKSTNFLRMVKWITFLVDVWFQSILSCPNAQLNLKSGKKKNKTPMAFALTDVNHSLTWIIVRVQSSAGKESACSAGDPNSIPGSGRSAGEEIGYPFLSS